MKNKLATWSWVLPIFAFIFGPTAGIIANSIGRCGYINFATNNQTFGCSFVSSPIFPFLIIGVVITLGILGLVFGIVTLAKIRKNPTIPGKDAAIIGIIFSLILFISIVWFLLYILSAISGLNGIL